MEYLGFLLFWMNADLATNWGKSSFFWSFFELCQIPKSWVTVFLQIFDRSHLLASVSKTWPSVTTWSWPGSRWQPWTCGRGPGWQSGTSWSVLSGRGRVVSTKLAGQHAHSKISYQVHTNWHFRGPFQALASTFVICFIVRLWSFLNLKLQLSDPWGLVCSLEEDDDGLASHTNTKDHTHTKSQEHQNSLKTTLIYKIRDISNTQMSKCCAYHYTIMKF